MGTFGTRLCFAVIGEEVHGEYIVAYLSGSGPQVGERRASKCAKTHKRTYSIAIVINLAPKSFSDRTFLLLHREVGVDELPVDRFSECGHFLVSSEMEY
jgi:hypothetical protein